MGSNNGLQSCCKQIACCAPQPPCCPATPGVPTVDCCRGCPDTGCPRGFKPCVMTLSPPANCDPRGIWIATIEKCPPKRR